MKWLTAAAAVFLVGIGSAGAQPPPPNYAPIPPPRAEVVPPPPAGPMRWEPGRWDWNGRRYVWVGGHYIERPVGHWVEGHWHWSPREGRYVWRPAHWE